MRPLPCGFHYLLFSILIWIGEIESETEAHRMTENCMDRRDRSPPSGMHHLPVRSRIAVSSSPALLPIISVRVLFPSSGTTGDETFLQPAAESFPFAPSLPCRGTMHGRLSDHSDAGRHGRSWRVANEDRHEYSYNPDLKSYSFTDPVTFPGKPSAIANRNGLPIYVTRKSAW